MKTFSLALIVALLIGAASAAGSLRGQKRGLLSNQMAARQQAHSMGKNGVSASSMAGWGASGSMTVFERWFQALEKHNKKENERLIAEQEERKRNAAIAVRKIEEKRRKVQLAVCRSSFQCPPGHRVASISATADGGCEGTCERVTFDCAPDVKECPGSPGAFSGVGRDPENNCEFKECPTRLAIFTKVGDGFCRSRHNWKGRAGFVPGNGQDYKAFSGITLDECSAICELQTPTSSAGEQGYVCKGLGYFEKTKSCEIWYTAPATSVLPPKHGQEHGAVCYRVEHAK